MAVEPQPRLFTVDEYYGMARTGVLHEDDRVELIEGEVITMGAIGSHHAGCVKRLIRLFAAFPDGLLTLSVQDPVRLDEYSEPEPDVMLLRPRPDFYAGNHPQPPDVLLLVEVADTTLAWDRRRKVPLYAVAGVPEVWLVNLVDDVVELFWDPAPEGYRCTRVARAGESISPQALPAVSVAVAAILP